MENIQNYNTDILNKNQAKIDFDNIKLESLNVSEANIINSYIGSVDLSKIKGTQHPNYKNKTWSILLEQLGRKSPRAAPNLRNLKDNPNYYLSKEEKDTWSFYKKNNYYYINEGNHRTIFARYFFYLNNIEPIIYGVNIKELT